MAEPSASPVPRPTGADLMEWQSDVGPVPQHIGVLLVLSERDRRRLRDGTAELGHGCGPAPRSGLNRPTGPHRRMALVEVDEQRLRSAAHALGASINDVLLVGVGESLRAVEARAGRSIDPVVVSVPVAVRQPGARVGVGNAVGVMPVSVPTRGPLPDRVRQVAAIRRDRLTGDHGRSLPLVLLAFRVLHALHLVGWFENRQRLVNTFVSAIPALPGPLRIAGAEVGAVVPLVLGQGNTTVAFASIRYHGRFLVTVATDPDVGPDTTTVAAGLRATLDEITAAGRQP